MPSDNLEEQRWEQHRREHDTADDVHRREHETAERALQLAVENLERRLEALNELRQEVIADRGQFIRSETHHADVRALESRMSAVKESFDTRLGGIKETIDRAHGAVNTWRGIAAFLGAGGVAALAALVWALISGAQ